MRNLIWRKLLRVVWYWLYMVELVVFYEQDIPLFQIALRVENGHVRQHAFRFVFSANFPTTLAGKIELFFAFCIDVVEEWKLQPQTTVSTESYQNWQTQAALSGKKACI